MNKDLGFDKGNLIYIPVRGDLRLRYPSLKRELSMHPNIEGVTAANILPTHGNESPLDDWEGNSGQDQILVNITSVDYDYERFVSDYPFEFHFLDTDIDHFYQNEKRIRELFTYFTFLAIFIACLGLLGLASFMTEQRTREIGIRKVLGASMSSILILLCKEFIRWVLMANIIALPVAYYAMNSWLQSFAYQTQVEIWIFLVSAALAVLVAFLTVSYQAIKAALANPVDALKYE